MPSEARVNSTSLQTAPWDSGYVIVPIACYCSLTALVTPLPPSTQSLLAVALSCSGNGKAPGAGAGRRQCFTPRSKLRGGPNHGSHTSPRVQQTAHQDCAPPSNAQVQVSCSKPPPANQWRLLAQKITPASAQHAFLSTSNPFKEEDWKKMWYNIYKS